VAYRVCPLDPELDRSGFSCGVGALDRYFRERVTQDIRRRVATCFVALDEHGQAAGFYTLAAASVLLSDLPETIVKKLPRYPSIPAIRMGRLAIHESAQGQGLGSALLADALSRCMGSEIAAFALVVDAKNDAASAFYQHHGFLPLSSQARTLFLPLATARKARR
jgi:ribosomal protein S18 acetylase RimI-like enzyme